MDIKLIPKKQIFYNSNTNFRVISCVLFKYVEGFELSKYNNFTLSGNNLSNLALDVPVELNLEKDETSKYPASYILKGYTGVNAQGNNIKIDSKKERQLLLQFMTETQADNVNSAYPNFVQMVLDGKEEEIDHNKIYNVGESRLHSYIENIYKRFNYILYMGVCDEWGINDFSKVTLLSNRYNSPDKLKEDLEKNPYDVFINKLEYKFSKADSFIINKKSEFVNSSCRCEYGCLEILEENESEGNTRLDYEVLKILTEELIPECQDIIDEVIKNSELIWCNKNKTLCAKKSTYEAEVHIADNIVARVKEKSDWNLDWEKYTDKTEVKYTDEQKSVLKYINDYNCCMIRGQGGTGKTSVMKAVILMLEDNNKDYLLLSPTGKAAQRLKHQTGRDTSTVHLYLAKNQEDNDPPDIVIIDEASFIGVELLSKLFTKIPPCTKIVFVCDEAQLPSIACGNVVQDIINSEVVPMVRLTKVFRYGDLGIATVATDTREGKISIRGQKHNYEDYQFIELSKDPIKQVVDLYDKMLSKGYTKDDIVILCPYNKTNIGTYKINEEIQAKFNDNEYLDASYNITKDQIIKYKIKDKVINTTNKYKMPLWDFDEWGELIQTEEYFPVMNGDIGTIYDVKSVDNEPAIIVNFNDKYTSYNYSELNNLLLAYSISCHKSQGDEWKVVIAILTEKHKKLLSRNLLYVIDSRAEKELYEISDINTIKSCLEVQVNRERETFLRQLLQYKNKKIQEEGM